MVGRRRRSCRAGSGSRPAARPLGPSGSTRRRARARSRRPPRALAVGRDVRRGRARSASRAGERAHGGRLGRERASRRRSPTSGGGSSPSARRSPPAPSAIATASSPPGASARRAAREERRRGRPAAGSSASGRRRGRTRRRASNASASATTVVHVEPAPRRARAARRAAPASRSSAVDRVARAREVERDAPGARADVEHGAARRRGQLAPQRQVGGVGAALDVVPDHGADVAHRQYSSACAAPGEQVAQLEQRGVGRQRVQRAVAGRRARVEPALERRRRPRAARRSTPAYFSRSASSAARVPEHVMPPHARREDLPVGVPHPGDVAPVGGAVVEHAEEVELRRPRAPACAAPRSRRPGS